MSSTLNRHQSAGSSSRTIDIRDRALHLVDLENLARGPGQEGVAYRTAWDDYTFSAGLNEQDHVEIASCGLVMAEAAFSLPTRYPKHCANGADGAENLLLGIVGPDFVARRYEWLVIGSGDHAFVPYALEVQRLGGKVRVVSARNSRSSAFAGHGFAMRDLVSRPNGSDLGLIA